MPILGEPQPVLVIDAAAPRPRERRRRRIERHRAGLGVDLADAAVAELEDVGVVLLVGVDAVDADRPAVRRNLERAEVLVLAGLGIELHDLRAVGVLHPDLAVGLHARHREMRLLRGVGLPFLRHRIDAELFGLAVEPRHAALVHHADPDIAVGIDFEIERALRMVGLEHRDRIVRDLAGVGIELGQELLAEMREPDAAVGIDDDVVRLDLFPRQIVFGDDDARGAACSRAAWS